MVAEGCPAPLFKAGSKVRGFRVIRVEDIPDVRATAYLIEHEATGARVIHLHTDDRENLFSVGFRTPPRDSTGVAHILEHSVLVGSERYPVKDAFNELVRGTLQTFINAFTYPDKTVYPVASRVRKDFFNLARVYTDLVLRPRLLRETFLQEGHHLEFLDSDNLESDLTISGIVYNEMKGVHSSADALMWKSLQEALLPDTVYAFDSGGNPEVIPYLTYEQLVEFHRTYYSPSNAYFFICGDIPTDEHLSFLEEMLDGFGRTDVDSGIEKQPRWERPVRVSSTYPIAREEDTAGKTSVNVAWLLADNTDSETILLLRILSEALVGGAAGPLRKALIESGLGEDMTPVTGLETDLRQAVFAVGLRGTDPDKADAIEEVVLGTLRGIVADGFERDIIEGALHQVEFEGKEIVRRQYPYAIKLMRKVYQTWLYGGDPFSNLKFGTAIDSIRDRLTREKDLFERLLKEWFLENPHRVLSVLEPSKTHNEEWDRTFNAMMRHCKENLSQAEKEDIRRETEMMKVRQVEADSEEALGTLPKLRTEDIPREVEMIPSEETLVDGVPVVVHDVYSNGIAYINVAFDVSDIPDELQVLLPLLGKLTTDMGAAGLSYTEMAKRIALKTGGIDCRLEAGLTADGRGDWQKMVFSARCLDRNIRETLAILADLLCAGDLSDTGRIRDLIFEKRNRLYASVIPSGHLFARRTAAAPISVPAYREEQWYGRTQLQVLNGLVDNFDDDPRRIFDRMCELREWVFKKSRLQVDLTADEKTLKDLLERVPGLIDRLADGRGVVALPVPQRQALNKGISIPAKVCFVARVFPAPPYKDRLAPSLMVLSRELSNNHLYKRVRLQGGAYGGMSVYDAMAGYLAFLSYRDPNLEETLKVYDDAIKIAARGDFKESDIEKAKVGTIGLIDRPMDPATKGYTAMVRRFAGITDKDRQAYRDAVFESSLASVKEAAERHLSAAVEGSSTAVYAPLERLQSANEKMEETPLEVEPLTSPA